MFLLKCPVWPTPRISFLRTRFLHLLNVNILKILYFSYLLPQKACYKINFAFLFLAILNSEMCIQWVKKKKKPQADALGKRTELSRAEGRPSAAQDEAFPAPPMPATPASAATTLCHFKDVPSRTEAVPSRVPAVFCPLTEAARHSWAASSSGL